jgi:hypothetical protein
MTWRELIAGLAVCAACHVSQPAPEAKQPPDAFAVSLGKRAASAPHATLNVEHSGTDRRQAAFSFEVQREALAVSFNTQRAAPLLDERRLVLDLRAAPGRPPEATLLIDGRAVSSGRVTLELGDGAFVSGRLDAPHKLEFSGRALVSCSVLPSMLQRSSPVPTAANALTPAVLVTDPSFESAPCRALRRQLLLR